MFLRRRRFPQTRILQIAVSLHHHRQQQLKLKLKLKQLERGRRWTRGGRRFSNVRLAWR